MNSQFSSLYQFPAGPWSEIVHRCENLQWLHDLISQSFVVQVGNGARVQFWHDAPLKNKFPRLYSLSTQQLSTVQEIRIWDGCLWCWKLKWRRALFQWEQESVEQLQMILAGVRLYPNSTDSLTSNLNPSGVFRVKDFIEKAYSKVYATELEPEVCEFIWKKRVPPRAQYTVCF